MGWACGLREEEEVLGGRGSYSTITKYLLSKLYKVIGDQVLNCTGNRRTAHAVGQHSAVTCVQ